MGAHPIGECFNQGWAGAAACPIKSCLCNGYHGQDVISVYQDTGEPETICAFVNRSFNELLTWLANGPLVVLAKEYDRGVKSRCKNETLIYITLSCRSVTKVGNHGVFALIQSATHGVTNSVEHLVTDHDCVAIASMLKWVPTAIRNSAVDLHDFHGVHTAHPGDTMFAIGRECKVIFFECKS